MAHSHGAPEHAPRAPRALLCFWAAWVLGVRGLILPEQARPWAQPSPTSLSLFTAGQIVEVKFQCT